MWKVRNRKNGAAIKPTVVAIGVFSLLFCYCNIITFEYLDVTSSIEEHQDYFYDERIYIHFSVMPDKNDVERRISLTEDGSVVTLVYDWQGSALSIRPLLPWQRGQHYSLNLNGVIRMEDGRTYTVRFHRTFTYGERNNVFKLVSNEFNNDVLTLQFSKPVLITSFEENFSLAPFTGYRADFYNDGSTVIISSNNGWAANTAYFWTIRNMISTSGYLMRREYSGMIHGIIDTNQPFLEFASPVDYSSSGSLWFSSHPLDNNLRDNQAIGFSFSKPMDEASVVAGISFFPSISGFFVRETDRRFIFVPNTYWQLQREYRITIADTIRDSSGLPLFQPKFIFFTTANRFLEVTGITFDDHTALMPIDGSIVNYVMIPPSPSTSPVRLRTTINFSTSIPVNMRHDAVNAISLDVLFPASANSVVPISAFWSDGGSRLSIEWSGFSISSGDIENHYILRVGGGRNGVRNQANEYLEEDVCVIFIAR